MYINDENAQIVYVVCELPEAQILPLWDMPMVRTVPRDTVWEATRLYPHPPKSQFGRHHCLGTSRVPAIRTHSTHGFTQGGFLGQSVICPLLLPGGLNAATAWAVLCH